MPVSISEFEELEVEEGPSSVTLQVEITAAMSPEELQAKVKEKLQELNPISLEVYWA